MSDARTMEALASAIYMSRLALKGEGADTDDKKIRASGLYEDWQPGKHSTGEIYNAAGQTWECYQDYDNAVYPDLIPGGAAWPTFNRPLHGETPETARPWVTPTHSMDIYQKGECMIWTDGLIYRCKQPTNFSPADFAQAWEKAEA